MKLDKLQIADSLRLLADSIEKAGCIESCSINLSNGIFETTDSDSEYRMMQSNGWMEIDAKIKFYKGC